MSIESARGNGELVRFGYCSATVSNIVIALRVPLVASEQVQDFDDVLEQARPRLLHITGSGGPDQPLGLRAICQPHSEVTST